MIYGRELRELEEEIMGKANENMLPNVETGDINKDEGSSRPKKENKTTYVGCWDSSLGRMRYENIDEISCDICWKGIPEITRIIHVWSLEHRRMGKLYSTSRQLSLVI
jgi:hypothetical protein